MATFAGANPCFPVVQLIGLQYSCIVVVWDDAEFWEYNTTYLAQKVLLLELEIWR